MKKLGKWTREHHSQLVNGIAFYPALIDQSFLMFSWLMIALNRAASKISNRTLDSMIGNRSQQIIPGFYIDTIVSHLFVNHHLMQLSMAGVLQQLQHLDKAGKQQSLFRKYQLQLQEQIRLNPAIEVV